MKKLSIKKNRGSAPSDPPPESLLSNPRPYWKSVIAWLDCPCSTTALTEAMPRLNGAGEDDSPAGSAVIGYFQTQAGKGFRAGIEPAAILQ